MIALSVLGPAVDVAINTLLANGQLTAVVGTRIVDNTSQRPVYPYIVVETIGEDPLNTMGNGWGSAAGIRLRVCSQYRGEREVSQIVSLCRGALDGHREAIDGFVGRPRYEWIRTTALTDTVGAVITREWLMEFEIAVSQ